MKPCSSTPPTLPMIRRLPCSFPLNSSHDDYIGLYSCLPLLTASSPLCMISRLASRLRFRANMRQLVLLTVTLHTYNVNLHSCIFKMTGARGRYISLSALPMTTTITTTKESSCPLRSSRCRCLELRSLSRIPCWLSGRPIPRVSAASFTSTPW